MVSYAHPEVLVETDWLAARLNNPEIRIVEVDYDPVASYDLGHIPGAKNVPWGQAVRDDGTFKSPEELEALYGARGIRPALPVITYCRIGERSSHSWFVLRYLLGFPEVRNYDGSWTEWGNLVRSQIEK